MNVMTRTAAVFMIVCLASATGAQTIRWRFGETEGNALPSEDTADFVSGGCVTNGNTSSGGLGTSSASTGYAEASGGYNAFLIARTGAFATGAEGSSYFEVAVWPSVGYGLSATNLAFGVRCTSTGPQAFCVRSSLDSYGSDLATGDLTCDSTWHWLCMPLAVTSTVAGATVTLRIYGFNGSGNTAVNWRIDDLALAVCAHAMWDATPPDIEQMQPQSVRVGKTLNMMLAITPTDGDPVTYTNVEASAGVTGAWSLDGGIFTYTPEDGDYGARAFTFSVADKDGTNAMTVAVSVLRRTTEAVSVATSSGLYVQSFDALSAEGTTGEWDNAACPFASWYAYADAVAITAYRASTGGDSTGALYSYGSASTNADRSLGSLASDGKDYRYGMAFTNATGLALTNVTVSFTAEQWRVGANARTNSLVFEYCVTNRVIPLPQGVWRRLPACCFLTPAVTNAEQVSGACYWAVPKTAVLGQPVPDGDVLLLRWTDIDDAGNDHGFGIDDLSVSWSAGPLPEAVFVGRAGVFEFFDEMNTNAVADLPFLWRIESRDDAVRTTGSYAGAPVSSTHANDAASISQAGTYNFAASVPGDQAVGGLGSGTAGRSVTVFGKFANAAGVPVRRWSVSYHVEKYRNGTVGTAVRLLASTDGQTWSAEGDPAAFAADSDTNSYAADGCPGSTLAVVREAVFDAPVACGGVFYLAWQISPTEGDVSEGAQALGVDDVQITPVYAASGALMTVR